MKSLTIFILIAAFITLAQCVDHVNFNVTYITLESNVNEYGGCLINDVGSVFVTSIVVNGNQTGYVIHKADGTQHTYAYNYPFFRITGVNNQNFAVGFAREYYTEDLISFVHAGRKLREIGISGNNGDNSTVAVAINNNDKIVGYTMVAERLDTARAVKFNGYENLAYLIPDDDSYISLAMDINDANSIVGITVDSTNMTTPFYMTGDKTIVSLSDSSTLCGTNIGANAFPLVINHNEWILGTCDNWETRSFSGWLYDPSDETYTNLGSDVRPTAMNDEGTIVGIGNFLQVDQYPFLYQNGSLFNIEKLVPTGFNITGFIPESINNFGQIVGDSDQGIILLNPEYDV